MEITHKNPGIYKVEQKPALHIFFAWIASSLFLTLVTLTLVPDVGAKNHDYCDKQFDRLMFREVPTSIKKECGNRFIYNTNVIKRAHPLYPNF